MKYIYFIMLIFAIASCKNTPPQPVQSTSVPIVEEPANIPMADSVVIYCGQINRKIPTSVALALEIVKDDSGKFDSVKACNYIASLRIEEMKKKH